ncbi:MAG: N-6 DNA methylase [Gallionellaceae bacterium]|nr:N-6 DNA methylase [Gallionellaceae bacterium]
MIKHPPITLDWLHASLGWNRPEQVLRPDGAGTAKFATLVQEKIGRALARETEHQVSRIGVLAALPNAVSTEPPIAVVVEFSQPASEETLCELHRLAWNFSHCPALITIEPSLVRVWTCCEAPVTDQRFADRVVHTMTAEELAASHAQARERTAANSLHWINLVSGVFFAEHAGRFNRDGRADQLLLRNLRHIRQLLANIGLDDDDVCHDLLARIIFVQFLFDRRDVDGNPALTASKLARLHAEGVLSKVHTGLDSILSSYTDAYAIFEWLNERFNGDLFPGKGDTPQARAKGWAEEKRIVNRKHLSLLADFIRGNVDMPSGQHCLWPQYSFDVIPLEFISSIYETFVDERAAEGGVFYTPPHLVDFVLDKVLPWDGSDWDLKVLDPSCGSGIFLVKVFQRLVHRWRLANPGQTVRAELLRRLLERNLIGVDIDPHAVRVACFSLYLAMCDEIEPRHYWTQVVFPSMRDRRLLCSDFFAEQVPGINTQTNAKGYDLVVGNAPWGEDLVTTEAKAWAAADGRNWTVANKDIGGLFLAKAAQLLKPTGRVAMIQSASAFLFNTSPKACGFRKQLFQTHRVEEVINLAALRFDVFKRKSHTTKTSVSPSCIVVLSPGKPAWNDRISYVSPKRLKPLTDEFTIVVEPQDCRTLYVHEALNDPTIWTVLMWGSNRDRALLKRLIRYPTISNPGESIEVLTRQGFIYGDRKRTQPELEGRPLFDQTTFPQGSLMHLDTDGLPPVRHIRLHSKDSTSFAAFEWPQLILKKGLQRGHARFQARMARSKTQAAAVFNDNYVSIHGPSTFLEAACLTVNSLLAVYFLKLTSGRVAAYRPAALTNELLGIPISYPLPPQTKEATSYEDIDAIVYRAFALKDAEQVLVEDLCDLALADLRELKGQSKAKGHLVKETAPSDAALEDYCTYFMRVLKAGFGTDKTVSATIFHTEDAKALPYQMVSIELGRPSARPVDRQRMTTSSLLAELERLDLGGGTATGYRLGIYTQRVVRLYDASSGIPTIIIIKPNVNRYWTRSAGLNDADEASLDLFRMQQQDEPGQSIQ